VSKDDYPTMRHWMNGGALTGFLGDQMEVEVRSALAEIERLRAERDAEHALADQLASELKDATEYGDWLDVDHLKRAREVLTTYEEHCRERQPNR
jgi:hypothetical protein